MITINKRVAVEPFVTTSTTVTVVRGMPQVQQRVQLTKLKVVFPYNDANLALAPGDTIWVHGDACKHEYAKSVFEEGGKSFILLPVEMLVGMELGPRTYGNLGPNTVFLGSTDQGGVGSGTIIDSTGVLGITAKGDAIVK